MVDLSPIQNFLGCATPQAWLDIAPQHLDILLIDHAHCEKKAASTAMNLLFRYVDRPELLKKLSQLTREEMLHFEQVVEFMEKFGVTYDHLSPARYANGLRQHIRTHEPERLIDTLIIGAFIEARSCERFAALAPVLEQNPETAELAKYYVFLLKSESRHFEDYLALAELYSESDISDRVAFFREAERRLIESEDAEFRFHSGVPAAGYSL
ncbi:MAG: tRNA isopentenyl-2-thiomethyl-A-37 hydroxylase MiaE [Pseudomonadales bacterium]|nr:tRNA isopentenyl-2-thiomethyl-A-37 hydroxylase MiaE [Pseudomonadales bacterium]